MIELIVACDKNFGIGKDNRMIWNIKEELDIFKQKTLNNIVIFGKNTVFNIPPLIDRKIICISNTLPNLSLITTINNNIYIYNNLEDAISYYKVKNPNKKIFIAGGEQLYSTILNNPKYYNQLTIHISIINNIFDCDKFIKFPVFTDWVIIQEKKYDEFTHYILQYCKSERKYLDLLQNVLINGEKRLTRNSYTRSLFNKQLEFDLEKEGFPLLTSKKMFFRGIVEELLFFLRGDTDSKILEDKNVNIWKENTNKNFLEKQGLNDYKEGLLGPMYGYQWRFFNSKYDPNTGKNTTKGVDQLKNIIDLIKNDPKSRRIIMTTYNPEQAPEGVLYPCHSLCIQFYVYQEKYLDMNCYNRSSDLFLGLPFNIASSALFLSIIAKCTDLIPRKLYLTLGDVHIYKSHKSSVKEQLSTDRTPLYQYPTLNILKNISTITDIEKLQYEDFELLNYKSYSPIKAEMIA